MRAIWPERVIARVWAAGEPSAGSPVAFRPEHSAGDDLPVRWRVRQPGDCQVRVNREPARGRAAVVITASALALGALSGAFYALWEYTHRGVYAYSTSQYPFDDADEWRYTACSRLVEHGYSLFSQVYSAQPPLFFWSLAAFMRFGGDSIASARTAEIIFGAIALLAAVWLAWQLAGPPAGAVAAVVLAVSPPFLLYSHAVEAEGPMMAFMTLSLALAVRYRRTGSRIAIAGAGLVLAAALLMKLFALEAFLPVFWLIASRERSLRGMILPFGAFCAFAGLPLALDLALVSPRQQWSQVISLHSAASTTPLPNLDPPLHVIWQFLVFDGGLTGLAVLGVLALAVTRRFDTLGFVATWLGGQLIMLALFRPLFPHHPAILSTSLAVCAGVGAAALVGEIRGRRATPLVLGFSGALLYCAFLPRLISSDRHTLLDATPGNVTVLAHYVAVSTSPNEFVAADNVRVAEQAGRMVPPPLCDPSNVRFYAGQLSAADLIGATRSYRAALVIATGNFNLAPSYIAWVRTHYRPVTVRGGGTVYRLRSTERE